MNFSPTPSRSHSGFTPNSRQIIVIVCPLGFDLPEHMVETLESLMPIRFANSVFLIPFILRISLIRSAMVSIFVFTSLS